MSYEDDDDLLAALGRAIGPAPTEGPSDAEVAELRALVVRRRDEATDGERDVVLAIPIPITRATPRWRRRAVAGGLAAAVVLSGATAVAAAVNDGALPSPVRYVVHAVGIPVDSIELAAARDALRRLRTANDAELADALEHAERTITALGAADRTTLGDEADRALADGRERLAKLQAAAVPPTTATTVPEATAPSTPTTPPTAPAPTPPGTTTATTVDDHGGSSGSGGSDDSSGSGGSGHSGDDSSSGGSTATSDDRGGSGGGGSGTTQPGSPATSDDSGGHGGDSTAATSGTTATTVPGTTDTTDTTDTTIDDHGGGSGGGGSGGGGSGGGSGSGKGG